MSGSDSESEAPDASDFGDRPRGVAPALIVAVVAISFAAIFFKKAFPTHPQAAAGIRLVVASVLLLPFVVRAQQRGEISARMLRAAVLAGLLYGLHFGSWVWSLSLTTVAASVTLVTATPILLALVALATGRDRPDSRLWGALALAFLGIAIIGGDDLLRSGNALVGDALALVGMAAMAGYLLVGRSLGEELKLLPFSGIATGVGGAVLLAIGSLLGLPMGPSSTEALLWLVLAALVPQLIGHNALTWALRHAKPTAVGMATVGEPVGATVLGVLLLAEYPSPWVVLGCGITLVAVGLAVSGSAERGGGGSSGPRSEGSGESAPSSSASSSSSPVS